LLIECEPYAQGWSLVKRLDSDGMSQTIGKPGWAFLYIAGVVKTSVFGSDEEKTTRKALITPRPYPASREVCGGGQAGRCGLSLSQADRRLISRLSNIAQQFIPG
jgi:hypothetical protein